MSEHIKSKETDYNQFIGREGLVNRIYARIGAGRPQSVSIVGDVKIGKSSLLWYLAHQRTKEKMLHHPQDYIYIYMSCRQIKPLTLTAFTNNLYELTRPYATVDTDDDDKHGLRYNYFKRLVESHHKENVKIILFLDDFNLVTQNQAFPLEFFSFLRSLANNYNLAYVTTSYEDLQKLCVSKDIEESPFFNIFTNMSLRGFEEQEVRRFFEIKLPEMNGSGSATHGYLRTLVGNTPYPLQVTIQKLKEFEQNGAAWNQSHREEFESLVFQELSSYYEQIWNSMESIHQTILSRLALGGKIPNAQEYLVRDLSKRDYVRISNGKREIACLKNLL